MASKANRNRYRVIRSVIASASVLSFLPLLGLMRAGAHGDVLTTPAAEPAAAASVTNGDAVMASAAPLVVPATQTSAAPAATQNASATATTPATTASSAASSTKTVTATYTRTKAS